MGIIGGTGQEYYKMTEKTGIKTIWSLPRNN